MALEKPFIPIVIRPATSTDIGNEIAKVMEGSQFLLADDKFFLPKLKEAIIRELATSKSRLHKLVAKLQDLAAVDLAPGQISDHRFEKECQENVVRVVKDIEEKYKLYQPKKVLSSIWPNLDDRGCRESIIGNIRQSLQDRTQKTVLAFVGVSLKFSLQLITEALENLSPQGLTAKKALTIQLVHMDDQSHILHAVRDTRDIETIRRNFETEWQEISAKWENLCKAASIDLEAPKLYRIDYIPSRVGILIDDNILYAGRCALKPVGSGTWPIFHLDVGELEYQFHMKGSKEVFPGGDKAIDEFKGFLKAYGETNNNSGVSPVWRSDAWLERLEQCIADYNDTEDITFISASATKFESMIVRLLERRPTTTRSAA